MRTQVFGLLAACVLPTACSDTTDNGSGEVNVSVTIGLEGGDIRSQGVRLSVPEGALDEPVEINVRSLRSGDEPRLPAGSELASRAYALTPHGQRFDKPVELELPFERPEGRHELRLARLQDADDDSWEDVRGASFEDGTVVARLEHFSIYAVVACDEGSDCGLDPDPETLPEGGIANDGGGGDGGVEAAVSPPAADLSVMPSTVDFGDALVDTNSLPATFTFKNDGTATATSCNVSVGDEHFSVFNDNCSGASLAPAESCSVDVLGAPTSMGSISATVALDCDGGVSASADVSVRGTAPQLTLAPASRAFGPVPGGTTSVAATFTFRNDGTAPATGCLAPLLSGADATAFSIVEDNCATADLAAGTTCTVSVSMSPLKGDTNARTATLSRDCSAGGAATSDLRGNLPHYLFLTSVGYYGDMDTDPAVASPGGLAAADSRCQELADAGALTMPLGRTWRALLSTTSIDARDRITWEGPVFDARNLFAVADPTSWPWTQNGAPPPNGPALFAVDETDTEVPDLTKVWTGSTSDGTAAGVALTCADWADGTRFANGERGDAKAFPDTWLDSGFSSCSNAHRLVCVSEAQ